MIWPKKKKETNPYAAGTIHSAKGKLTNPKFNSGNQPTWNEQNKINKQREKIFKKALGFTIKAVGTVSAVIIITTSAYNALDKHISMNTPQGQEERLRQSLIDLDDIKKNLLILQKAEETQAPISQEIIDSINGLKKTLDSLRYADIDPKVQTNMIAQIQTTINSAEILYH